MNVAACIVNTWHDIYQLVAFKWPEPNYNDHFLFSIPKTTQFVFLLIKYVHYIFDGVAVACKDACYELYITRNGTCTMCGLRIYTTIVAQPLEQLFASWSVIRKLTNFISLTEEQQESIFDDTIHSERRRRRCRRCRAVYEIHSVTQEKLQRPRVNGRDVNVNKSKL